MAEHTTHPVGPHDVGGRPAGAVGQDDHAHALWERRVDAMEQTDIHVRISIVPLRCKYKDLCELRVTVQSLYTSNNITKVDIICLTCNDDFVAFEARA